MAWIEIRGKQPRAYWRTPTGRTYEPFTTVDDAEKFLALGAVLDGDFEKARALVRGAELAGLRLPTTDTAHGAAAMVAAPNEGDYPPETYTLAYVFEAYVTSCKARPRGKDDYRRDFRLHIAPYFGEGTDVRRLTGRFYLPGQKPDPAGAATGTNVAAWLEWLEQRPAFDRWGKPTDRALSPKTIRSLHGLLSAALEYACRVEPTPLLLRNPCAGSNLPEAIPMPMHFLTRTGAQALLRHLDGMAYVVVLFALYTGLRFGEIAGLDIRDLDLDAEIPTVQVRQAWSRVTVAGPKGTRRSTRMLALPKTVESHRKIGFPRFLVPHLRPLIAGRPLDAPVFTMPMGGRLHHGNFLVRWFRPAVEAAAATTTEVPADLRIHDLRHTHASWMVRLRPLNSVKVRMGHRSIQTTDRYLHLLEGQAAEDVEALESEFPAEVRPLTVEQRAALIDRDLPLSEIDDCDDLAA